MKHWYGVKTLFRTRAYGRPAATDRQYDPEMTLVEERVVLYRAASFEEAFARAERDASSYAADTHENPYGQLVRTRYLGCCDAYELFDDFGGKSGTEVYSRTEIVPRGESDAAVCRRLLRRETRAEWGRRRNVLNAEFSGRVRRR